MPWTSGSTSRWGALRAAAFARDGFVCSRCSTPVHHRCSRNGCHWCAHVHHIYGTRHLARPDQASLDEIEVVCRRCNLSMGDPTRRRQVAIDRPNLMAGVTRR
jgi:5-methylcytosine-specific restriction endonuclease McrA